MMNRRLLLLAAIALVVTAAYAQNKTKQDKPKAATPPPKPVMEVAIGKTGNVSSGTISKTDFDAASRQGLHIKDPQGAFIEGFSFTYAERNLYEDSLANEKIVTEYLTQYCMGDSLGVIINNVIADRSKPGDTAFYDDIHIRMADGKPALGKPMKFVITR